MTMIKAAFGTLPVNTRFRQGTCDWLKVSTRTARLNGNGAWFYFGKHEVVSVDEGEYADVMRQAGSN